MLRIAFKTLIACMFSLVAGGQAHAQVPDVGAIVSQAILDMTTSTCIDPEAAKPYSATFYGILPSDPHFSPADRERLNAHVLDNARRGAGRIELTEASNLGAFAELVGPNRANDQGFARAIAEVGQSIFPTLLTVTRPDPDVARLKITVYARGASGAPRCNRSETIDLDIETLETVTSAPSGRDYLTIEGAFAETLARFAPSLEEGADVSLTTRLPKEACSYWDRARDRFLDAYSTFGQSAFDGLGQGRSLPPLAIRDDPDEAVPDGVHTIELSFEDKAERSFDLVATLRSGGRILARQRSAIAVSEGTLASCVACLERGDVRRLSVSPGRVRSGDALTVAAEVERCEPAFFAVSANGRMTPIPTQFFSVTRDGGGPVRYEISPSSRYGLVIENSDPRGDNLLGLVCSSCEAARDRTVLGRMVQDVRAADRRGLKTGRFDDGVPYAIETYEKID